MSGNKLVSVVLDGSYSCCLGSNSFIEAFRNRAKGPYYDEECILRPTAEDSESLDGFEIDTNSLDIEIKDGNLNGKTLFFKVVQEGHLVKLFVFQGQKEEGNPKKIGEIEDFHDIEVFKKLLSKYVDLKKFPYDDFYQFTCEAVNSVFIDKLKKFDPKRVMSDLALSKLHLS